MSAQQDKAFFKAFGLVLGALVIFTISMILLSSRFSAMGAHDNDPLVKAQLVERLQPVGKSRVSQ